MTQNPTPSPLLHTPPNSLPTVTAVTRGCYTCNSGDNWILHNVKFNGECRKLCTSCVLKQHPTSFCPTCFNLHDPNSLNPPPLSLSSTSSSSSSSNRTLTCLKCNSVSHITCVPANTPKSPYLCPPCSNPNFKFFDLKKPAKFARDGVAGGGGVSGGGVGGGSGGGMKMKKVVEEKEQFIDEKAARVLLLAAKISAISMNRVVALMRSDVERKVREAALARKRAKEAIDHVMALSSKFGHVKPQRREVVVSGTGASYVPVKLEKNGGAHNVGGSGVGNGNGAVAVAPPVVISNGGSNENHHHVGKESNT